MIPLMSFLSPSDRRVHATLDAILKPPRHGGLVSNGLTYRYNVKTTSDGLQGQEGTFNVCTFWLVEAMAEMGRADPERVYSARFIFEQMLGYANHLGLFAEETGPSGEALGNFPQALTHLGLINAAYRLDKVLG
jgi:GH15 family glucan-1,4-alpha-glucosidase